MQAATSWTGGRQQQDREEKKQRQAAGQEGGRLDRQDTPHSASTGSALGL